MTDAHAELARLNPIVFAGGDGTPHRYRDLVEQFGQHRTWRKAEVRRLAALIEAGQQ